MISRLRPSYPTRRFRRPGKLRRRGQEGGSVANSRAARSKCRGRAGPQYAGPLRAGVAIGVRNVRAEAEGIAFLQGVDGAVEDEIRPRSTYPVSSPSCVMGRPAGAADVRRRNFACEEFNEHGHLSTNLNEIPCMLNWGFCLPRQRRRSASPSNASAIRCAAISKYCPPMD
jgi:hypothetical protein